MDRRSGSGRLASSTGSGRSRSCRNPSGTPVIGRLLRLASSLAIEEGSTLRDSYDFEYDCESEAYGEHGLETDHTTISINVTLENEKPRMYLVEFYLRDTPTTDLQSV